MQLHGAWMPCSLPAPQCQLPVRRIRLCKKMLSERVSFTLETTLAGHRAMGIMRKAKSAGYRTLLVYVSLGDPELHIERVRLRVSQGGHDIPDSDIRRR